VKKFLFLIPQSPGEKITSFRKHLIDASRKSLLEQSCTEWEAWMLGEEEKTEGNFRFIKCPLPAKEQKLHHAVDLLLAVKDLPEYIIRFDDDDLVNPDILSLVTKTSFDCFADKFHCFYDVSSNRVSAQERPWLANTVIHKAEHALAEFGEYHNGVASQSRKPRLIQNDHSKTWHVYYSGKKVMRAEKSNPVYVRVLSPSSITAAAAADKEKYTAYLASFGSWDADAPGSFSANFRELESAWRNEYGEKWEHRFKTNGLRNKLKHLFGRH
jgi:hypothetical protein